MFLWRIVLCIYIYKLLKYEKNVECLLLDYHIYIHTHTDILNKKFLYQCMTDFFVLLNFQEVIEKFGRFIGRNAALGRQNTPEEEEALKSGHYTF